MTDGLFVTLFALPLLASLVISVFLRRSDRRSRGVALAVSGTTAVCATALLPMAGDGPTIHVEWLPGTGSIALGLGATGLYAALVTTWVAFLTLLGTASVDAKSRPLSLAAMLVAVGAANVAFLTEQFLARYVALEIVALCVALAPLIELRGDEGSRGFWLIYLILRLGDAGLLSAILILFDASGTLQIASALQSAGALGAGRLGWTLFGLLLAVWVKLGNWPFHLWVRYGRSLALETQAWLFAAVMPNLGAYLLYRIAPLLPLNSTVQTLVLWLGAGVAMLTVLLALTRRSLQSALIYIGAARGGLLVFAAASGAGTAVWLALLATTPLQLLLFLAGGTAERGTASMLGRVTQALFGVAGVAMAAVALLITYWARRAQAPLDAVLVAETATGLLVVWAVRETARSRQKDEGMPSTPARWVAMGGLGLVTLSGALGFGPLARWLVDTAGVVGLPIPTLMGLVRYVVTAPALLLTLGLVLVAWWMRRGSGVEVLISAADDAEQTSETYDVEDALVQAARALHAVVEVGLLEQLVLATVRAVVSGALVTFRLVEHEGFEGLLRRVVQGIVSLGQAARRMHTGVLRHNLLWIPLSLTLALIVALIYW